MKQAKVPHNKQKIQGKEKYEMDHRFDKFFREFDHDAFLEKVEKKLSGEFKTVTIKK